MGALECSSGKKRPRWVTEPPRQDSRFFLGWIEEEETAGPLA
jgi:hypothetical protein